MNRDGRPNLFVIGAMKCGTTSLHEYLDRHPDIGMSRLKEINFFSGENAEKPMDWYLSHFDLSKPVRGESSQSYSKAHDPYHRGAPARMAQLCPDAKLVYLVRDPIDRYLSHIVENYLGETEEIKRHNTSIDTYVRTGMYHYQVSFFLEHFPLEQILVVDSDDLRCNRLATMNRIFDFLDVPRIPDPSVFEFEVNANGEDVVPPQIGGTLPYRAARRIMPRTLHWLVTTPVVRKAMFSGSYKTELGGDERARLAERFAPDVAALRALTGQSFSSWSV